MRMRAGKIFYTGIFCTAAMMFISCGAGETKHPIEEQMPGTITDGVYLSGDGRFTVKANETLWQMRETDGGFELYRKENGNIWISFSPADGLASDMLADFETSFVKQYMEGIQVGYPDAQAIEIVVVNEFLARVDMTMTYDFGAYTMYQILYLVTDGENGYIITATLPEDEAKGLRQEIYQLVESIEFLN